MNWIDIMVLSIVGLSVLIGIFRGFIREALSLLSWALAIAGGVYFHDIAANYFSQWISSESIRSVVGFSAVFIIILIVCSLVSHFVGFLVKKSGLGGTDKMLGVLFGFVRGVLVCGVCLLVVSFSPVKSKSTWQQSQLVPYFKPLMSWLNDNVPDKLNVAKEYIDKSSSVDRKNQSQITKQAMQNLAELKHTEHQKTEDMFLED